MAKGFFLVIDGPNGVGKSTICTALNERLARQGRKPYLISEPSRSQIGELVKIYRERPEHNLTLACLLAADRYSNIIEDIRPKKAGGYFIISDRYIYPIHICLPDTLWATLRISKNSKFVRR